MKPSMLAIHPGKLESIQASLRIEKFIVISGPSGVGKTEIVTSLCPNHLIIHEDATLFDFSESYHSFNLYLKKLRNILNFTPKGTSILIEDLPLLWTKSNEMDFKRVLMQSQNQVIILYNTSLPEPFKISKYTIKNTKVLFVGMVPKTYLKKALDQKYGRKIPKKDLSIYFDRSQGDIRQFLINYEYKLCFFNQSVLNPMEYCANILYGTLPNECTHAEPHIIIPFINYNCILAYNDIQDVANTLDWCSYNYSILNHLKSNTVNELSYKGLNTIHQKAKKSRFVLNIENPFKLQLDYHNTGSLLEEHARQCPQVVTFSDDDSIVDLE
eukprot:NODE_68_length_23780_cov_0.251003.p6 type:complete len:327 gc:universal NODE_68_length_23780_cov_0.251003:1201-2181(+)